MPKFNVRQSLLIDAPVEKIYGIVRDFKQWQPWSPWLLAEPGCEVTHADDGRSYAWSGQIVGAGEIGIIGENAPHELRSRLVFLKPWKSVASVDFKFTPKGDATEVTWSMESSLPFFLFWMKSMMAAFISMDYRRGLLMLKDYAETGSVPSHLEFVGPETSAARTYVGIRRQCPMADLGVNLPKDFAQLGDWLAKKGLEPAGKGFAVYHHFDAVKDVMDCAAAIPISQPATDLPANFVTGKLPDQQVYTLRHTGPYRHLGNAWAAGHMRERAKVFHLNKKAPCFETYENCPSDTPENGLVTSVCFPLR